MGLKQRSDKEHQAPSTEGHEPKAVSAASAPGSSPTFVTLHFEIKDTGVGIAPEELDKVFDAFVQTESGRQSRQGTGLGLPISREYVRMMGGDLVIESVVGEGTCFEFDIRAELPTQEDIDALVAATSPRHVLGLQSGQVAPDGGPYRLLVIEDVEASRRLLVQLLQPLGFEVRTAVNGQEGVDVWQAWYPHLIFMDMGMPVMDGHEATKRIRSLSTAQTTQTVIIALTASAFEEDRESILSKGCDDFIRKPFREALIFDVLERHLGVQFVYAEEVPEEAAVEGDAAWDPAVAVAALPDDLRDLLYQASLNADIEQVDNLITDVRTYNVQLAKALSALAYEFAYNKIQELLRID